MSNNRKICRCRNITYLDISKAIELGAKNIEDIMMITGAATCCGGCTSEVLSILDSSCECNDDSKDEVFY